MLEIRNWLLDYSSKNNSLSKGNFNDSLVYQFDMNLILMIDKEQVNKMSKLKLKPAGPS